MEEEQDDANCAAKDAEIAKRLLGNQKLIAKNQEQVNDNQQGLLRLQQSAHKHKERCREEKRESIYQQLLKLKPTNVPEPTYANETAYTGLYKTPMCKKVSAADAVSMDTPARACYALSMKTPQAKKGPHCHC